MDSEKRDKLSELVEELTTSGEPTLNPAKMKEVKKTCRISNHYIEHLYHLIMTQLDQDHAEIRLSAFHIVAELFSRSHHFRVLLVDNMQDFLDLTVETDTDQPLPPPKEVAQKLKRLAIHTVQSWHATYGDAYKKLALGYHFLKQVKKVDFQDVEARTLAERRRQEDKHRRLQMVYKEKIEKAKAEMEESCADIEENLTEIHNCMTLLVPDPHNFNMCNLESGGRSSRASTSLKSRSGASGPSTSLESGNRVSGTSLESGGGASGPSTSLESGSRASGASLESGGGASGTSLESGGGASGPSTSLKSGGGASRASLEYGGGASRASLESGGGPSGPSTSLESGGGPSGPSTSLESGGRYSGAPGGGASSSSSEDGGPCCSQDLQKEPEMESSDSESESEVNPHESCFLRNSGIMTHKYSLELNISTDVNLQESEDNEALLNTVRDLHRLITTKHLPNVQSWIQVFTRAGGEEQLLKRALDLKNSLEAALEKHTTLNISHRDRQRRVVRADDSDEDFEEVPEKEGFEPHILDALRVEYGLEPQVSPSVSGMTQKPPRPLAPKRVPVATSRVAVTSSRAKRKACEEEQDPASFAATLRILKQRLPSTVAEQCVSSSSSKTPTEVREEKNVPVVPFGIDLYYWGKDQPTAGKIIKNSSTHQVWMPYEVEEEVVNEELSAAMKTRRITFAGSFEPVQHKCRAPLPNGALCERQDRLKCPFHGRIIPRDDSGRPTKREDAERLEKERMKLQEEQPDWRDPELMREIEAATGEDLGSSKTFGKGRKGSKGKGKKKKYPSLTDLKQSANTSRSRLEKKVFNKSSMRRVTDVMNKMDARKHDKFSNQFNYAFK